MTDTEVFNTENIEEVKKPIKKAKKPMSEERKAQLLANLKKGRETSMLKRGETSVIKKNEEKRISDIKNLKVEKLLEIDEIKQQLLILKNNNNLESTLNKLNKFLDLSFENKKQLEPVILPIQEVKQEVKQPEPVILPIPEVKQPEPVILPIPEVKQEVKQPEPVILAIPEVKPQERIIISSYKKHRFF